MRAQAAGLLLCVWGSAFAQEKNFSAITFSGQPGKKYVAVKEIGYALNWPMRSEGKRFFLNEQPVDVSMRLLDGTRLIALRDLEKLGMKVDHDDLSDTTTLWCEEREFLVTNGAKRVEISKRNQMLRAFQGEYLVAEFPVSTGRRGFTTPSGTWAAGPEKARMRYSRKYDNAPMPYAVQITGGYFMHGYTSVPRYPASHGCVRLPLWGANPARWLFSWVDVGIPITIATDFVTPVEVASREVKPKPVVETKPKPTATVASETKPKPVIKPRVGPEAETIPVRSPDDKPGKKGGG
jgi:hypothetical protein